MEPIRFASDSGRGVSGRLPQSDLRPAARPARARLLRSRLATWTIVGALSLAAVLASCATSQTRISKPAPLDFSGDIRPPTPIFRPSPQYPEAARIARVEGNVVLESIIGSDGSVESVTVIRSAPGLDQAAVEALKLWKYRPATLNGNPVKARFAAVAIFKLDQPVAVVTEGERASVEKPLSVRGKVEPPVPIFKPDPEYPESARAARIEGKVIVEAIIGEDGSVESVQVTQSVPELDQAALDAIKQWRYKPATLDGEPVRVRFTVIITFTLEGDEPPPTPPTRL